MAIVDAHFILRFAVGVSVTALATAKVLGQPSHSIDLTVGQAIHPGIRGQNVPTSGGGGDFEEVVNGKTKLVAENASIRGVAGGLAADTYNWINQSGSSVGASGIPGPPTLDYLRAARDLNAELVITVNARGTGNGLGTNQFVYQDTDTAMLASLAANWVRYANEIAPNFTQGSTLSTQHSALVHSLQWGNSDRLRDVGETATKKVTYWEIGNEPDIGIVDADDPVGSGGYSLTPAQYADRYVAITQAMLVIDPGIKVGPVVKRGIDDAGTAPDPYLLEVLNRRNAQVDFISYHPYTALFTEYFVQEQLPSIATLEERLRYIHPKQQSEYQLVVNAIKKNNEGSFFGGLLGNRLRDENIPVMASEYNPGHWPAGGSFVGRTMAQAMGVAETIFSFAQNQNMIAAHYWTWPVSYFEGADIPTYKMLQALRDHMGDTLVDHYYDGQNFRLYTTKDSGSDDVVLWGLNSSDDQPTTLDLSLIGLEERDYRITLMRLANIDGTDTSLMSFTSASAADIQSIDWLITDLTGILDLSNFSITFDDATITVLLIQPVPEPTMLASGAALCYIALLKRRRPRWETRSIAADDQSLPHLSRRQSHSLSNHPSSSP